MTIPGGNYIAELNHDGSYTIKGVPIMAELPEGSRENDEIISTEWFRACLRRHAMLEKDQGYLAPCHLNHHDLGRETPRIGFLRPTEVGSVMQDGIEVPALLADIVGLKEEHLEAIQNNDLAYRSVEISSWDRPPEISSLALLSDEAPWYKLPLLNVSEIRPAPFEEMEACTFEDEMSPLVAMRGESALLFRFQEKKMPRDTKTELANRRGRRQRFANGNGDDNGNGKKKDDDDSDDDSIKLQDGTDAIAQQVAELIAEFQGQLPDLIGSYLDGLIPAEGGGIEEALDAPLEEEEPMPIELQEEDDEEEEEKLPIPLMGNKHYRGGKTAMLAELAGRVAALETEQKARQNTDNMNALIRGATQSLRDSGWSVPKSAVAAMREIATGAKNPQASVLKFTESYKQHAPRDPASTFESLEGSAKSEAESDVMKFAEMGPGTLEKARKLANEYDSLKATGFDFRVSREDHIRENLSV